MKPLRKSMPSPPKLNLSCVPLSAEAPFCHPEPKARGLIIGQWGVGNGEWSFGRFLALLGMTSWGSGRNDMLGEWGVGNGE